MTTAPTNQMILFMRRSQLESANRQLCRFCNKSEMEQKFRGEAAWFPFKKVGATVETVAPISAASFGGWGTGLTASIGLTQDRGFRSHLESSIYSACRCRRFGVFDFQPSP
jgi:hypothetical protein